MLGSNRGVSNVMGTVLLVAIVVGVSGLVLSTGALGLGESKEKVDTDTVRTDFETLAGEAKPVVFGDTSQTEIELEMSEHARSETTFDVEESTGSISVEVGGSTIYSGSLGMIEFEHENTAYAYSGGGVWQLRDDHATNLITPPTSMNDFDEPTYTLPIIQVLGDAAPSNSVVLSHVESEQLYQQRFVPSSDSVEISIQSKFYTAWKDVLMESFDLTQSQVSVDNSQNRVTIQFGAGEEFFFHVNRYTIRASK
jgi:flagellin-like protein